GYQFPQSAFTGDFRIPNAETLSDLSERIRTVLQRIKVSNPGKTVLVSTHSGVIWTILHRIVANPPEEFFWPSNCSMTRIHTEKNRYIYDSFQPLSPKKTSK